MRHALKDTTAPGTRLYERGTHAIIVACGGAIWAFFGLQGLQGWRGWMPFAVLAPIPLLIILAGLYLRTRSIALPLGESRWKRGRGGYLMIVRLEYLAIGAAIILCALLQRTVYLLPIIAVIVGVHFFALRSILPTVPAIVKGAILTLVGALTVALLPQRIVAGAPMEHTLILWEVVPGLLSAAVLWFDGVSAALGGFRLLREAARMVATSG